MVARSRSTTGAHGKRDHERPDVWAVRLPDGSFRVGFTRAAARQLGPIVYLRGPQAGRSYAAGEPALTLESEKCVRQVDLPVACVVLEVNEALETDPGAIHRDPYGEGWLCRLRPKSPSGLEAATRRPPKEAG